MMLSTHSSANLQQYAEKLRQVDFPAYKDGKEALYMGKLMLVKMAHKDWTPLDRQWITSQAKRLRAAMPAACHFGCEGALTRAGALQAPVRLKTANDVPTDADDSGVLEWEAVLSSTVADAVLATLLLAAEAAALHEGAALVKLTATVAGASGRSRCCLHWRWRRRQHARRRRRRHGC
jgi:hypothetical protein